MEVGGAAVVEWGQRKAEFLPDIRKFQVPSTSWVGVVSVGHQSYSCGDP